MTSKYDQELIEKQVTDLLDESEKQLSSKVKHDIRMATRAAVLRARHEQSAKKSIVERFVQPTMQFKFALPAFLAVALLYGMNINNPESIPALPANMLAMDLPPEDLGLLEDLEFADWLAEQEVTL